MAMFCPRMRRSSLPTLVGGVLAVGSWLVTAPAAATDVSYALHAEGAAARMVGPRKVDQFGWGGAALAAPELTIGNYVGLELPVGILGLTDGAVDEPGYAETEDGTAIFALPGVRVRPFGRDGDGDLFETGGLWVAGGGGVAETDGLVRPAFDARLGYDLRAGSFRFGPFGGFLQIVETESELRPEDARVLLAGLHGSFAPPSSATARAGDGRDDNPDRDGDGILNDADACPDDPEDFDGLADRDGCPEIDADQDGIADPLDRCPLDQEDVDTFEDADGCPDPDNDEDGVLDDSDQCPLIAEDPDGFDDEDGCPEGDNDRDGIVDGADDCPNDPETFNGYADEDGCPDVPQVRVEGKEIVLDDRVYFRVNSAKIEFRSWSLIENLAKLLKANPQYALVHVQGHADDTGADSYNQKLSIERSMSVRDMLIAFGVAAARLTVQGFGEARPAESGTTVGARRKNRRVEFLILKRTLRKGEATELSADWLRKALGPSKPAPSEGALTPAPPPGSGPPSRPPAETGPGGEEDPYAD